jgi:uncharacterized protein
MAKRVLGKMQIEDIAWGSTLLGAGGGGSARRGLELFNEIKTEATLLDPSDLPDNATAVTVAGIGSPLAISEKKFGPEAVYAYDAIKTMASVGGVDVNYMMLGELGGFNSLVPIYVAIQKNIPVIDADGNGRAVPELSTTLYSIYKIPTKPLIVANSKGDVICAYLADALDTSTAETIARTACVSFGMLAAFSTWIVDVANIKRNLVTNSVTKAEKVGRAIREARASGKDPVKEVLGITGGKEYFRGKIQKIEMITSEGFDFGKTHIEGIGEYKNHNFMIDVKNENIIAWLDGKVALIVPDLIAVMTTEGEPLTNADTREGMEVAVLGIPAAEPWKRSPEGFNCWKHILQKIGYQGNYVSTF